MDHTHPAAITIASAPCSRYVTLISLFSLSSKKSHNKLEENSKRKETSEVFSCCLQEQIHLIEVCFGFYFKEMRISATLMQHLWNAARRKK